MKLLIPLIQFSNFAVYKHLQVFEVRYSGLDTVNVLILYVSMSVQTQMSSHLYFDCALYSTVLNGKLPESVMQNAINQLYKDKSVIVSQLVGQCWFSSGK